MHRLLTQFAKGISFGLGILTISLVAYAWSTWLPGNAPQTSPVSGNVGLQYAPIPVACGDSEASRWNGSSWSCIGISESSTSSGSDCVTGILDSNGCGELACYVCPVGYSGGGQSSVCCR